MPAYERAIRIDAPPAAVWAVMSDVEKWSDWTPTIVSIVKDSGGALAQGMTAHVTVKGRSVSVWGVTELVPERSFTWETAAGPGLRVAAGHTIVPVDGGSRVTLTMTAHGPAAPVVSWLVRRLTRSNVDIEAESLKRYLDQQAKET